MQPSDGLAVETTIFSGKVTHGALIQKDVDIVALLRECAPAGSFAGAGLSQTIAQVRTKRLEEQNRRWDQKT